LKPYTLGTVVDGELVGLIPTEIPISTHCKMPSADSHIVFYAFDILAHGGENVKAFGS